MNAERLSIEWDEDGAYLILELDREIPLHTNEGRLRVKLNDPEQCYDAVKGGLWPWIAEKEAAYQAFLANRAKAFECEDPFDAWVDMLADNADHSRKVAKGE